MNKNEYKDQLHMITFRVGDSLFRRMNAHAKRQGLSRADIIRMELNEHLPPIKKRTA